MTCSSVLFFLATLILLVSLGFWQLGRADEKEVLLAKQAQAALENPRDLLFLMGQEIDALRYRKASVTGVYETEHQYLIDNQIMNGRAGFFVMTPLKIEGVQSAVLVNRGWVPLNQDRQILPDISLSLKKVSLLGRINSFPSVGIKLAGAEIPTEGWPSIVQVVDSQVLADKLEYPLLPFQFELNADESHGYVRRWKKNTMMSPEKHIGYAVQWFGLAITLTILFIRFSLKNK
ncbi:MAG: SURF1 family protein [Methylococcales bacterium]|nr:SURF1 family protein [Methylococcales bacterium]